MKAAISFLFFVYLWLLRMGRREGITVTLGKTAMLRMLEAFVRT